MMNKLLAAIRFLFRKRLSIDSSVLSMQMSDYYFSISQQQADEYRSIVEPPLPVKTQLAVHPLYLTKISWFLVKNLNQFLKRPIAPQLLKMLVHMSDRFEYFEMLEIDTKYRVESHLSLIEGHSKGVRLMVRFEYFKDNKLIAVEHTGGLLFGVKCLGGRRELGAQPQNPRYPEILIWQDFLPIDKNLPFEYAKKAEIDAPIHTQPEFAKSIGLPDIILQGTCTFAKAVSLVWEKYYQRRDYSQIKCLSANFTGMLFVPNEIKVRLVYQSTNKLVFDVLDKDGNSVIKGGCIELNSGEQ
ncbi:MAG: MaoC/PaaZ C-terminal domain-containing protein [Enterobacterales bacterium]|nr:MaoC/PaaZ C-terminal domain-containing protein [Enterobacterales bacterium]